MLNKIYPLIRIPFFVSEIFKQENRLIMDRFLKDRNLFDFFFSFISNKKELNSTASGYFLKAFDSLMSNNCTEVSLKIVNKIFKNKDDSLYFSK